MNNPFRENAADETEVRKHRITEEQATKRARNKEREETKRADIADRSASPAWFGWRLAAVLGVVFTALILNNSFGDWLESRKPQVCKNEAFSLHVHSAPKCSFPEQSSTIEPGDGNDKYMMCTCPNTVTKPNVVTVVGGVPVPPVAPTADFGGK